MVLVSEGFKFSSDYVTLVLSTQHAIGYLKAFLYGNSKFMYSSSLRLLLSETHLFRQDFV